MKVIKTIKDKILFAYQLVAAITLVVLIAAAAIQVVTRYVIAQPPDGRTNWPVLPSCGAAPWAPWLPWIRVCTPASHCWKKSCRKPAAVC